MSRISVLEPEAAAPESRTLLDAARRSMGTIPNLLKALAHSPAALDGYLSLGASLAGGTLSPRLREQVAVAVAGHNGCEYCASAHTALGRRLKLDDEELHRNLHGTSGDPATAAALAFVRAVIDRRGEVSDAELQAVRAAGFSDGQVAELVGLIALNTFTNYFNGVARTDVDFPRVEVRRCACAAA